MNYRILTTTLLLALPIGAIAQAPSPPKPTTRAGPAHTITTTFQNASCNTVLGPCTGQIYKANSACPSGGGIQGPNWTLVIGNLTATTVTATNSTFTYTDANVVNGLTYCIYATNTYANAPNSAEGPGGPSNTFQVQVAGPPQNPTNLNSTVN